jgi:hypothetical protein
VILLVVNLVDGLEQVVSQQQGPPLVLHLEVLALSPVLLLEVL